MHEDIVDRIISGNEQIASFWGNSHGWAPDEAADLMSKSRLDWQVELSKTLKFWDFEETQHGQLILAWANLGALIEGTLKLLLAVYYLDYVADNENFRFKGKLVDPDSLALEKLKQFYRKKELLEEDWFPFIELVQQRRNAIHAFKDRPIGNAEEFENSVAMYLELLITIIDMLPYPNSSYKPRF